MKQIYSIFSCIILCMIVIVVSSCSSKESSKEDLNYQNACEELNYSKAWNIVVQLKKNYDDAYEEYYHNDSYFGSSKRKKEKELADKEYRSAFDYVLRSEINYLISNGDETSAKRIMVLFNERKIGEYEKKQYIKEFTKLAISLDNNYVVDLFVKSADIDDEELIEYMVNRNTTEYSDKVLVMLAKEFGKCKQPSVGLHPDYYLSTSSLADKEAVNYCAFNSTLNKVLDMAISGHNQYLAQKILNLYTKTVVVIEGTGWDNDAKRHRGVKVDHDHIYIEFDNSEIAEARRKYNEAVKSGSFKH